MMEAQRPDDATLSAWLDGHLDGPEGVQAQAWLHEHPEDAARVRMWAADRDALRARFDSVLAEPVPERLRDLVLGAHAHRWRHQPWLRAAAVALIFVIGAAAGIVADRRLAGGKAGESIDAAATSVERWPQRAAIAHAVYAPEVRHPVEVSVREGDAAFQREQEQHLSRWLTRRLELPVKLFDLRDQGFELVGGRLLPDAAGPSAQLMYQDASGQRVTVYLRKPEDDTPAAFRYEKRGGLGMFYWVEGRCGYALVGPQSRERLLALAEAIFRQDQLAQSSPAK
jgi:anti-sigma factor RsiW